MMQKIFPVLLAIFASVKCKDNPTPKTWALLVAGSNEWYNYRHQADICHAYQILHAHGIPDENIIVMMYDDIANNTENPTKGVIINHNNGSNVYENVPKDYTGEDVTPENFIKILTGDKKGMKGIGSGKVIESTKHDHVFVNFVDHGAPGILAFPSKELTAGELMKALNKMHSKKQYNETVLYIEACESGSMFEGILPKDMSIFATTAASSNESSYACYFDDLRQTYLGDCYSVNWMEDTDQKDISRETLYQQFLIVKKTTNTSHVKEFGDLRVAKVPVGEFQGEDEAAPIYYPQVDRLPVPSYDVPLVILQRQAMASNDYRVVQKLRDLKTKRKYVERIFGKVVDAVALQNNGDGSQAENWLTKKPTKINDLECHTTLVHAFSNHCLDFGKNPYALRFAHIFVNMCNDRVNVKKTVNFFKIMCRDGLMYSTGIH